MSRPKPRRWWLASLMSLLAIGDGPSPGQGPPKAVSPPLTSALDPKLEAVRKAAPSWESRRGPDRAVVDQVCLVPDLPTFLEAISAWDEGHYFPVLLDDVESSFRFIRAFRPARIIRMPKSANPISPDQAWDRAIHSVGASWSAEMSQGPPKFRGDRVPKGLGPTPPGAVISSPTSPMLAGAVALAAGRFQPLLRLDHDRRFSDVLSLEEADAFRRAVDDRVRGAIPDHDRLGDDCDFLAIAGDYPYRYRDAQGEEAVDDRVGRLPGSEARWAFAGRLLGDVTSSVYRAMCGLFLQPESALLFNGYDENALPWSLYSMRGASLRLSATMTTSQVSGDAQANLEGWHEAFDPASRYGLVLINSHGSPTEFNVRGGPAHAPDIPRSVPAAVLMIHSFAAADPNDPSTVAGRWLANGAFAFFGSINEPFLDAFRTPRIEVELIGNRMPLVVAARQTVAESRGMPWRLVFLGDPLYRIKPRDATSSPSRLDHWEPTDRWPAYAEPRRPPDGDDPALLFWSLKAALAGLQKSARRPGDDVVEALLAIRRGRLPEAHRPIYDSLLIEVLVEARRRTALKARLIALPEPERGPDVRRALETLLAADIHLDLSRKDFPRSVAAWVELMKIGTPDEFKRRATSRVGQLADTPARLEEWRGVLRSTTRDEAHPFDPSIIEAELKRVDDQLDKGR